MVANPRDFTFFYYQPMFNFRGNFASGIKKQRASFKVLRPNAPSH
jgi:hypothetical protein